MKLHDLFNIIMCYLCFSERKWMTHQRFFAVILFFWTSTAKSTFSDLWLLQHRYLIFHLFTLERCWSAFIMLWFDYKFDACYCIFQLGHQMLHQGAMIGQMLLHDFTFEPSAPIFQLKLRRTALLEDTFRHLANADHDSFKKRLVVRTKQPRIHFSRSLWCSAAYISHNVHNVFLTGEICGGFKTDRSKQKRFLSSCFWWTCGSGVQDVYAERAKNYDLVSSKCKSCLFS